MSKVMILGAGMHPWGKWGRNFIEYGVTAARAALTDAGVQWSQVQMVCGAATMRNGYPGYVAGSTFAQALGWQGARLSTSYAACASGAQALATARSQILSGECELALVVGADTTPKGFFAPQAGERPQDPDWVRFRLGVTNASYFGLHAWRRMQLHGTTLAQLAQVKVKNAAHGFDNPYARYRKRVTMEDVAASPVVASPLRLLEICATSDGGAALVLASERFARQHGGQAVELAAAVTSSPRYPRAEIDMPELASDCQLEAVGQPFRSLLAQEAYEAAGLGPEDLDLAEVYDLSSAMELQWYEDLALCPAGDAEKLLEDGATTLGGSVPVNPSGGLACFGEAVPAQGLAQVCELVWQLRGDAGSRQVADAKVGVAANQGLFGHGSVVLVRTAQV